MIEMQERFPLLRTTRAASDRHFADPFVIATAQHFGATVVSHESADGIRESQNAIKIPDICAILNIRHVMFHRIVVDEGWVIE